MMPEAEQQAGTGTDTGAGAAGGIQIPLARFNEVIEQAKEARSRANAAETAYKELLAVQKKDADRLAAIERRFAPEPEADAYEDPADKALKEVADLRKRLEDREQRDAKAEESQQAAMAITAAIRKAGIKDVEAAQAAMAEGYGASKFFTYEWDPDKAAAAFRERETKLAAASAAADNHNTDATRSALHGGGSPPAPATPDTPPRPSPFDDDYKTKLAAWEKDAEQRELALWRAAG